MTPPDGKSPRRSRAELKELLLDTATQILRDEGVGVATTAITYQRVFTHLEETQGVRVTRGSVHERIWASQRDFQLDVLRRVARWDPSGSNEATAHAVGEVLVAADLDSESGRADTMRDLCRVVGPVNLAAAEERDHWSSWIGIALALSGSRFDESHERQALLDTVAETYGRLTDELVEMNEASTALLQRRARADLFPSAEAGDRFITMLATALADGVALRQQFTDDLTDLELPTGPDGGAQSWHPYSVAMWAILSFLTEPIPED